VASGGLALWILYGVAAALLVERQAWKLNRASATWFTRPMAGKNMMLPAEFLGESQSGLCCSWLASSALYGCEIYRDLRRRMTLRIPL
jgi:hypothetical protein